MTTTPCQNCSANAPDAFLCHRCQRHLAEMLTNLAAGTDLTLGRRSISLIEALHDAAIGRVRLGDNGRRTPRYRQGLDGDAELASYIEELPVERCCAQAWAADEPCPKHGNGEAHKSRQRREEAALRHALARGRVNSRASDLLDGLHSVLMDWVRDLCEQRGTDVPTYGTDTIRIAAWLARNVAAIAADQGAGVCYREVAQIIGDIERCINRPIALVPYGPCPAINRKAQRCRIPLHGRPGEKTVTCIACKTEHDTFALIEDYLDGRDDQHFTRDEIFLVMAMRGDVISPRVFRNWSATGKLRARGYRRPDGRRGIARHSDADEPTYLLADVKRLRETKPQKAATGAAAHEKRRGA